MTPDHRRAREASISGVVAPSACICVRTCARTRVHRQGCAGEGRVGRPVLVVFLSVTAKRLMVACSRIDDQKRARGVDARASGQRCGWLLRRGRRLLFPRRAFAWRGLLPGISDAVVCARLLKPLIVMLCRRVAQVSPCVAGAVAHAITGYRTAFCFRMSHKA